MKSASAAVLATLANANNVPIKRCDLYTFILNDGSVMRITDADTPKKVGVNVFTTDLGIKRSMTKQTLGLEVGNITIDIYAGKASASATRITESSDIRITEVSDVRITESSGFTIAGQPVIHQFRNGLFDGASVLVQKMFLNDWDDPSSVPVDWFEGVVSDVACGYTNVNLRVENVSSLLNKQMPRNLFQATCNNTTYDTACGLLKPPYTFVGTASSVVNKAKFTLSGVSQPNGYFALGSVSITTGANTGLVRAIKSYISGVIELFRPFPYPVENGAGLSVLARCDKLKDTCSTKFSNLGKNRSFPYIPVPETAIQGGSAPGNLTQSGSSGRGAVGSADTARRAEGSYIA